ncbi:hypothetical protein [Microbacterium aerolatum]
MRHSNINLTYSTYVHLFADHHDMDRLDALGAVAPTARIVRIGG